MKKKLKFVDLFAGAGGLSLGFKQARRANGETVFEPGALIDNFEAARDTYIKNNNNSPYYNLDISKLKSAEIKELCGLRKNQKLDLFMGGPPCQGFSTLNKEARSQGKKFSEFIKDDRNKLLKKFLVLANELQPSIIMMENVPNMIRCADKAYIKQINKILGDSYYIGIKILNAVEYGVPQLRKRAFLIALNQDFLKRTNAKTRTKIIDELESADLKNKTLEYFFPKAKFHVVGNGRELMGLSNFGSFSWHVSVEEAIGDLPSLKSGEISSEYLQPPNSDYQVDLRNGGDIVFNHESRAHSAEMLIKMKKIKPGLSNRDLSADLRFEKSEKSKSKVDYLSQAYGRLHPRGPAYTITCNYHNPGSGYFTHYKDNRAITTREAARLQSFPDDYYFCGTMTEQSTQVGNAVPPILSKEIAEHLINIFEL